MGRGTGEVYVRTSDRDLKRQVQSLLEEVPEARTDAPVQGAQFVSW